MKNWFTSLNGAVTLSMLSLLAFIGYALMEMRYFLAKWIPGDTAAAVEMFIVLLLVGGWIRALFAAANSRRGGLIALLAFSGFTLLIFLYDLQWVNFLNPAYLPEALSLLLMLIAGVIALAALVSQLRQTK